jgi:trimethylamine:corrinoid methyltransferase-like protein
MLEFRVMTESELDAVHNATLRVLAETGITLTHPEAQEILSGAGAKVKNDRVLLPTWLVEQEVAKSTTKVRIRGRGGSITTWVGRVIYMMQDLPLAEKPCSKTCRTAHAFSML